MVVPSQAAKLFGQALQGNDVDKPLYLPVILMHSFWVPRFQEREGLIYPRIIMHCNVSVICAVELFSEMKNISFRIRLKIISSLMKICRKILNYSRKATLLSYYTRTCRLNTSGFTELYSEMKYYPKFLETEMVSFEVLKKWITALFPEVGRRDGAVYWTRRFSNIPEGLLSDLAWHSMQNIIVHPFTFLQIKEILSFRAVKSNGFRNMCVTWGKRQVAPHCMIFDMSMGVTECHVVQWKHGNRMNFWEAFILT